MRGATKAVVGAVGGAAIAGGFSLLRDAAWPLILFGITLLLVVAVMEISDQVRSRRRTVARVDPRTAEMLSRGTDKRHEIDVWVYNEERGTVAERVTAHIEVFPQHQDSGEPVARAMGKWRINTEPEQIGFYHRDGRDAFSSEVSIAPNGIPGKLVVVFREATTDPAYLFTNLQVSKGPGLAIPNRGAYRVHIMFRGVNVKRDADFELWNDGSCFTMFER